MAFIDFAGVFDNTGFESIRVATEDTNRTLNGRMDHRDVGKSHCHCSTKTRSDNVKYHHKGLSERRRNLASLGSLVISSHHGQRERRLDTIGFIYLFLTNGFISNWSPFKKKNFKI
jgi:hypothetical protein